MQQLIYFSSAKYGEPHSIKIYISKILHLAQKQIMEKKVKAEDIVRTHSKKSEIDYIIYRMPMVYGKNMNSNIAIN